MAGCRVRLWRYGRGRLRPVVGCEGADPPAVRINRSGRATVAASSRHVTPVEGLDGYWFEVVDPVRDPADTAATLAPMLARLLDAERDSLRLSKELTSRYEEIELLYSISEALGRTIRLEEAAQTIVEEVSGVVGSRRASIFVLDAPSGMLRPVAAVGKDASALSAVPADDPDSITARVFREAQLIAYDPRAPREARPTGDLSRGYRGTAFLSAPILYPDADGTPRCVGVINLTDRVGADAFSGGEQRLVKAIANQIGAAIENARLVQRDAARQRLTHELELAHDLQMKLLPQPAVLGNKVDVAARCRPAASVGGDFYNLLRLPGDRVGVMIGDVSSHGFGAALIMALAMAASGIHAESAESPGEVIRRLEESLATELERTDMFLTLLFAVLDPASERLTYASAGHGHAYRVHGPSGTWERLPATRPPLGLGVSDASDVTCPWRATDDLLVLLTDGILDATDGQGRRFGEARVLGHVTRLHDRPTREILEAVFADLAAFTENSPAADDRTAVLVRV